MAREDLEYVELSDFTAGIYADVTYSATNAAHEVTGAAQLQDTWGCVGHPSGGLVPLGTSTAFTYTGFNDYPWDTDHYPSAAMFVATLGAYVHPAPQFNDASSSSGMLTVCGFNRAVDTAGGAAYKAHGVVRAFRTQSGPAATYNIYNKTGASAATGITMNQMHFFASRTVDTGGTITDPGNPYVGWLVNNVSGSDVFGTYARYGLFPDPGDPGNDTAWEATPAAACAYPFGHQGRYCLFFTAPGQLGDQTTLVTAERIAWAPVNDATNTMSAGAVFVEENPTGIAFAQSTNANELFVARTYGPAFLIRGDLDNPEVVRMPSVSPTGRICSPAVTPHGLVYGTSTTVELWEGGETSRNISPQFDTGFWWNINSTAGKRAGLPGFAWHTPFLYAPNNLMWDSRTEAWWRLDNPATLVYQTMHRYSANTIVGVASYLDATQTTLWKTYDMDTPCADFSWRSQPMPEARGRRLKYREVELVAQGYGTVVVQIIGIGGSSSTATFTFNSTARPVLMRESVAIDCWDAEVKITSTGAVATAPTVRRVRLGHSARQQAAEN